MLGIDYVNGARLMADRHILNNLKLQISRLPKINAKCKYQKSK